MQEGRLRVGDVCGSAEDICVGRKGHKKNNIKVRQLQTALNKFDMIKKSDIHLWQKIGRE